jgi:hypothetical protein
MDIYAALLFILNSCIYIKYYLYKCNNNKYKVIGKQNFYFQSEIIMKYSFLHVVLNIEI